MVICPKFEKCLVYVTYVIVAVCAIICSHQIRCCDKCWNWIYIPYFLITINSLSKLFQVDDTSDCPADDEDGGASRRRGGGSKCCRKKKKKREREEQWRRERDHCSGKIGPTQCDFMSKQCPAASSSRSALSRQSIYANENTCGLPGWYLVDDLTYFLHTLLSLPCLLTQFLLMNDSECNFAYVPILLSAFPLMVYLIDNVRENSMMDILVIGNVIFLSAYSTKFNSPYGIAAAIVFAVIHFILKPIKCADYTKEIFYNFSLTFFCIVCLYTLKDFGCQHPCKETYIQCEIEHPCSVTPSHTSEISHHVVETEYVECRNDNCENIEERLISETKSNKSNTTFCIDTCEPMVGNCLNNIFGKKYYIKKQRQRQKAGKDCDSCGSHHSSRISYDYSETSLRHWEDRNDKRCTGARKYCDYNLCQKIMRRDNSNCCMKKRSSWSKPERTEFHRYEKGNYRNKINDKFDHVKYRRCIKGTRWWRHHCRLRHHDPDECSICSDSSYKSFCSVVSRECPRDCPVKSLISKRIQSRHKQKSDYCKRKKRSKKQSKEKCCIPREKPHCEEVCQNQMGSLESIGKSEKSEYFTYYGSSFDCDDDYEPNCSEDISCPNMLHLKHEILRSIFDFTQYLISLYCLPSVLTQLLVKNCVSEFKALITMVFATFPLVTYLVDNIKFNSVLDVLIITNGVFLTIFSSIFNNPYGFGAAFVFCSIHFILRGRRNQDFSKEMVYNIGIIVFCYLCLKIVSYVEPFNYEYCGKNLLCDDDTCGISNRFALDCECDARCCFN